MAPGLCFTTVKAGGFIKQAFYKECKHLKPISLLAEQSPPTPSPALGQDQPPLGTAEGSGRDDNHSKIYYLWL